MPSEARYVCGICHITVPVHATSWQAVFDQALLHLSRCSPPSSGIPNERIFAEATRTADEVAPGGGVME